MLVTLSRTLLPGAAPPAVLRRGGVRCKADHSGKPAVAAASAAAAAANPALARQAPVLDLVSAPDVVQRKRAELAGIAPGGLSKALVYASAAPLIWLGGLVNNAPLLLKGQGAPPARLPPPPFPLHEEFVTVNGLRLHCVSPRRRNPGKPLMLFLHGFPELWYSWRFQMEEFAADYDVVAVDQRGYNDSDKPPSVSDYRLAQLAADVQEVVKALGHESCTLVAHDWGGLVAWTVAGMYGPKLVERLIVMALPHSGVGNTNWDWAQAQKSSYMLLFQAPLLPEAFLTSDGAASMETFFSKQPAGLINSGAITQDDIAWYRAAILKPGAAKAALNYYRALLRTVTLADQPGDQDVWSALRTQLAMPTLLLHGEKDVALGEKLLTGVEAAFDPAGGGVEVKMLKDCSHWVQQDYPLQVNSIMRDWLRRQDEKKGARQ